ELASGKARLLGQEAWRQRLLEIVFHFLDNADELRMACADAGRQRHTLVLAVMAYGRMKDELGDACRKLRPVLIGDKRQHHVEGRCSSRRRKAVAIDLEQSAG